jgi:hypothetical protein
MDRGSINSFKINESLVGAGRFERPTPCAQGNIAMLMRRTTTSNKIKELRGNHLQSINRHVVNSVADRFIRFQHHAT